VNIWASIRRFIARIICLIQSTVRRLLYAARFPAADWRYDAACKRWILKESEGANSKGYSCAEFVRARIQSPATGSFNNMEPKWGPGSNELETGGIVAWLGAQGYVTGSCRCGCCRGEDQDCVVVYVFAGGMVDHVAMFDPVNCDWVAKRSAVQAEKFIERVLDPLDYVRCNLQPDAAVSTPVYYCKPGAPPARRDVLLMHRVARYVP
jgi:hypothetical protein